MDFRHIYVQALLVRRERQQAAEQFPDDRAELGPLFGRLFAAKVVQVSTFLRQIP